MLSNLDAVPSGDDVYEWSDFIELRAIAHPDKCFSRGDLISSINRGRDTSGEFGDHITPAEDGIVEDFSDTEVQHNTIISPTGRMRWRDAVNFISERGRSFGDDYPFSISDDMDTVYLRENLSNYAYLYLSLLIGASMRYIPRSRRHEVARQFEEYSLEIFRNLMPEGMEVRAAWASGGAEAPYRGTLFQKLTAIAADIRATPIFKLEDFHPADTGDGGIDMVAWHPMADHRQGIPIALAQCGCSRDDWSHKQLEASPAKLMTQMHVMHPWSNYYFMPQDLRWPHGDWAHKSDLGQAIIVDRLRMIRLARQYEIAIGLTAPPFLGEVLAMTEV